MLILAACAALVLPLLTACGSSGGEAPVLDRQAVVIDPGDEALQSAIQQFLAANKGPKNSQYEYTRIDLNNDGRREGLVLFTLPHSYWCGWSGCTLAVFEAQNEDFSLVSRTSRIRGPLVVGLTRTNGWEDIAVRLSGTDNADRNVLLKFNGSGYPDNPMNEAPIPYDLAALGGKRIFP